jgi:hypothetical protein
MAAQQWAMISSVDWAASAYIEGLDDEPTIPEVAAELDGLYNAAIAIADERREKLKRLREALVKDDDGTALRIAATLLRIKGRR